MTTQLMTYRTLSAWCTLGTWLSFVLLLGKIGVWEGVLDCMMRCVYDYERFA